MQQPLQPTQVGLLMSPNYRLRPFDDDYWKNKHVNLIIIIIMIIIINYSGLEDKCVFQPTAVESLGPLNETACQFLKDLGRRISAQSGDERERECLPVPKVICCYSAIQCYLALQQF